MHTCIFCHVTLTGEGDSYGMFDQSGSTFCRRAEDHFHMCHCSDCHCGGECEDHR